MNTYTVFDIALVLVNSIIRFIRSSSSLPMPSIGIQSMNNAERSSASVRFRS
jgi:hypothetical protein